MLKIILMMAITVDGKIGKTKDHFANWTSPEDKKIFVQESKKHGIILMGENTFNTFKKPLPNRLNVVFSENKEAKQIDNLKWVKGDIRKVLAELKKMGYNSALLGGGAYLNSLFLKEKLINELILTIEPKIFGQGLSIFATDNSHNLNLKLIDYRKINENSLKLHYQLIYDQ